MKYFILNDLNYIITKKCKLVCIYFLFLFLYFLFGRNIYTLETFDYFLNNIFCYNINITQNFRDILYMSFLIFNNGIYIYFSISLFYKDYVNFENLFTRINFQKWIFYKLIFNYIYIFIFNSLIFSFIFFFRDINLSFYIIIIKRIILLELLITCIYAVIIMYKKNWFICLIITITVLCSFSFNINLYNIDIRLLLIVNIIANYALNLYSKKIKFGDLKG